MQNEFPNTDASGRTYKEIMMPSGVVFRMYEDTPFTWQQVKQTAEEQDWMEPMFEAWERGDMRDKGNTKSAAPEAPMTAMQRAAREG